ncbi:radC-like JAB domain protein [Neorickettsia helminthoeca str. Oregon]|uniref:RadC-like JAB domain protein n=1 Tax=Neorickettsia helminthoeca str. Oregon TaxID=1286528 RepID=X5HLC2_9RICK|nr:JAB domain-containing protein [Neorickettsia helminthoeca]AHX11175.1 radC-like JAB domain protein [Neorickettsia helminthoeca str. Oregon]
MKSVRSVNDAVVAIIKIVHESMQAILREDLETQPVLKSWKSVVDYLRISIGNRPIEAICVLLLNKKYTLIKEYIQDFGAVDHTMICTREIIKRCLSCGASAIVLTHNHPSGNPLPSEPDLVIIRQLQKICQKVDIQLIDHFIITPDEHFSFVVNGLL